MGDIIHVGKETVQSAMRGHDELLTKDERAREERALFEDEVKRVKQLRDAVHRETLSDEKEGY